ncbi:MAG TPA: hypothetical protein VIK01_03965 [Polyangiaceae bacterium]
MSESIQFQIDDDEAAQAAVKEHQVDPVPGVADAQPTLPTHEGKVAAELKQERLDLGDQRCFKVGLGILILQVEELEYVGILDLLCRCSASFRSACACSSRAACCASRSLT